MLKKIYLPNDKLCQVILGLALLIDVFVPLVAVAIYRQEKILRIKEDIILLVLALTAVIMGGLFSIGLSSKQLGIAAGISIGSLIIVAFEKRKEINTC